MNREHIEEIKRRKRKKIRATKSSRPQVIHAASTSACSRHLEACQKAIINNRFQPRGRGGLPGRITMGIFDNSVQSDYAQTTLDLTLPRKTKVDVPGAIPQDKSKASTTKIVDDNIIAETIPVLINDIDVGKGLPRSTRSVVENITESLREMASTVTKETLDWLSNSNINSIHSSSPDIQACSHHDVSHTSCQTSISLFTSKKQVSSNFQDGKSMDLLNFKGTIFNSNLNPIQNLPDVSPYPQLQSIVCNDESIKRFNPDQEARFYNETSKYFPSCSPVKLSQNVQNYNTDPSHHPLWDTPEELRTSSSSFFFGN